ncbi:GNAT family N-acetyltransferase [uncultured Abyssibacter sp.]|uniref:GNAT family N-acetyltransferase n=1 Tax=uncultured Abyssibacter sp. TaxID=2320202 RepID=UPI0032B27D3E
MSSDDITLEPREDAFTVLREKTPAGGRYYIPLDGTRETAELTWHHNPDGSITADHTFVPPSQRGKGLANRLVAELMSDARVNNWQVIPACSYVLAETRNHPEWMALTATRDG